MQGHPVILILAAKFHEVTKENVSYPAPNDFKTMPFVSRDGRNVSSDGTFVSYPAPDDFKTMPFVSCDGRDVSSDGTFVS